MGKKRTENKEEEEKGSVEGDSSSSTSEQDTTPEEIKPRVPTEKNTTRPVADPIAMQCNNCGFYSTDLEHLKSECPTCNKELTSVYSGSTTLS